MSEPSGQGVEWMADQLKDITAADFLIELRRIADALEAAGGTQRCAAHLGTAACYLADRHVGHHITADGKRYWLDEE